MTNSLYSLGMYLIIKALHIVAVMSWFAGLVYLGRVLIYHRESALKSASADLISTLTTMENRAWKIICNPAMVVSVLTGLHLVHASGAFKQGWFHAKFLLIILLLGYHFHTNKFKKAVIKEVKAPSVKFLKIWNEILTVFLILIVFLVITKNIFQSVLALIIIFGVIAALMLLIKLLKPASKKS